MSTTAVAESCITFSGSSLLVMEFCGDSIATILDQRNIYPRNYFKRIEKYGIPLFVPDHPGLRDFLKKYMEQVKYWIENSDISKLVLVILSQETDEPLERWVFEISIENQENQKPSNHNDIIGSKNINVIRREIQTIIRQIHASITCLPLIQCPVKFDLLAYTSQGTEVPANWEESSAMNIEGAEQLAFSTLSTSIHKVNTLVQYKVDSI